MIVLITGGSGSGKSAYAEKAAASLAGKSKNGKLYYLATMQVYDEESRKRVERHQSLREGRGFVTIEQPADITKATEKMEEGKKTVLLECMSNLVANEMFSSGRSRQTEAVTAKIQEDIAFLAKQAEHLVIVTNNVFEDGFSYDVTTRSYMEVLGRVNEQTAALAEAVTEVVAGIPVPVKKSPVIEDIPS